MPESIVKRLFNPDLSTEYDEGSIISISDKDYRSLPRYLYSATLYDYLDDISDYGLGNKSYKNTHLMGDTYSNDLYNQDGIFLARDPDESLSYMSDHDADDIALMRIPKSILKKDKLYYDTNNSSTLDYLNGISNLTNDVTYFYADIIKNPTDNISIID